MKASIVACLNSVRDSAAHVLDRAFDAFDHIGTLERRGGFAAEYAVVQPFDGAVEPARLVDLTYNQRIRIFLGRKHNAHHEASSTDGIDDTGVFFH